MPKIESGIARTRRPGELNEPQKRRLTATCQYIDNLLGDIGQALHSATSKSPFPRYVVDVTPAQAREIEVHIQRFRSELLRVMAWQQLKPEPPDIPVTQLINTDLLFIDNAIEELKPVHLRGCGAVAADAVDELNGAIHGLRALVKRMESYLLHELGENSKSKVKP
jgi:hypothetical protein